MIPLRDGAGDTDPNSLLAVPILPSYEETVMSGDRGTVLAEMDAAAGEAEKDLSTLDQAAVETIAAWWAKWYMTAGHKRLGRIMVKVAKRK